MQRFHAPSECGGGQDGANLNTPFRLQFLGKVYELNALRRDGVGMLEAARAMVELGPALSMYDTRLDYLRLMCGFQVDEALSHAEPSQRGAC